MFSRAVGREEHCKHITGLCGECVQCLGHTGFAPTRGVCAFPVYTAQALGLLCQEPSEAGPGLPAPPRSKPLRFGQLGSPQRCRLSWACVLCPSRVRAAQVMRCLASAVAVTYRLPRTCHLVFWVYNRHTFSGVPCLSSGELISGCDPPSRRRPSRIPRSLG